VATINEFQFWLTNLTRTATGETEKLIITKHNLIYSTSTV